MDYFDLADPGWNEPEIWVRAYSCPRMIPRAFAATVVSVELERIRAELVVGTLTYLHGEPTYVEVGPEGEAILRTPPGSGMRETPAGTYLLLVTPRAGEGDRRTSGRLDEAEGLLRASGGGAWVYRIIFQNVFDRATGKVTAYIGTMDNPAWFDLPDTSKQALQGLEQLSETIAGLDDRERARHELALRWLASAGRERGLDSFIRYWIALETLALPEGDTNIRTAERLLEVGYQLDRSAVREKFALGRLHGLRSAIVHNGATPEIPGEASKYLEALFLDLLSVELGMACPRRAASYERQGNWTWLDWLTGALGASS